MNWFIEQLKYGKSAIVYKDEIFTYTQLYYRIFYYLRRIKEDIPEKTVVALISDYSFDSIALFFALYLNKNIIVPMINETEEKIKEAHCEYTIHISDELKIEYLGLNPHPLIQQLQDSGLILFSSGSTGKPKVMLHDLDKLIDSYRDKKKRNSTVLLFLLFDHMGGLNTLFGCIASGAVVVIPESKNPKYICNIIQKYKVTVLPTSPTFLNLLLLNNYFGLSSLKLITYGSELMTESLLERLKKSFPDVKFLQTFGVSEVGVMKTSREIDTFIKLKDDYKIVNGELWVKTNTTIIGYLNHSMEQFEDGWFRTGDLVEVDKDRIKIIGRNKNMINVGGEKVHPSEIENVILQIPEIDSCIVYGQDNVILGQSISVDVVLNKYYTTFEINRIIKNHCKSKLSLYKIPSKVNIVPEIKHNERFKQIR